MATKVIECPVCNSREYNHVSTHPHPNKIIGKHLEISYKNCLICGEVFEVPTAKPGSRAWF